MIWKCGLDLEAVVKIQRGWWWLVCGGNFWCAWIWPCGSLGIAWVPCIFSNKDWIVWFFAAWKVGHGVLQALPWPTSNVSTCRSTLVWKPWNSGKTGNSPSRTGRKWWSGWCLHWELPFILYQDLWRELQVDPPYDFQTLRWKELWPARWYQCHHLWHRVCLQRRDGFDFRDSICVLPDVDAVSMGHDDANRVPGCVQSCLCRLEDTEHQQHGWRFCRMWKWQDGGEAASSYAQDLCFGLHRGAKVHYCSGASCRWYPLPDSNKQLAWSRAEQYRDSMWTWPLALFTFILIYKELRRRS